VKVLLCSQIWHIGYTCLCKTDCIATNDFTYAPYLDSRSAETRQDHVNREWGIIISTTTKERFQPVLGEKHLHILKMFKSHKLASCVGEYDLYTTLLSYREFDKVSAQSDNGSVLVPKYVKM